jgi:beta-N-acetylhexosaminidase
MSPGSRAVAIGLLVGLAAGCGTSVGASQGVATSRAATSRAATSRAAMTATTAPCQPSEVVSSWSLARRAAQLVVAPVQEGNVGAMAPLVADGIGGIILFGASAPSDLGTQVASLRSLAEGGVAPLVMTDEEGGGVQRMANLVGNLPWARTMAATDTPVQVQALAEQTAASMRALGVTMDLAPVLDIDAGPGPNDSHPDGARSFSADPGTAATYGIAFADGLLGGGVIPVVKHFPGLGTASYNTDFGPATTAPLSTLEASDLLPFERAVQAGLPAVMVSNATVPGLTTGPASLSKAAVDGLLRNQMGFSGLVLTDSLSAGAISALGFTPAQAAVEAVGAGGDMVLYDAGSAPAAVRTGYSVVSALVSAVLSGVISEEVLNDAVVEVLQTKGVQLCPS